MAKVLFGHNKAQMGHLLSGHAVSAGGLGPELAAGSPAFVDNAAGGATFTYVDATRTVTIASAGSNSSYPRLIFASLGLTLGVTYRVIGQVLFTGSSVLNTTVPVRLASSGTANNVPYTAGTGAFEGHVIAAADTLQFSINGTFTGTVQVSALSVREVL